MLVKTMANCLVIFLTKSVSESMHAHLLRMAALTAEINKDVKVPTKIIGSLIPATKLFRGKTKFNKHKIIGRGQTF